MAYSFSNRITRLFNIELPIIQAGMVWASGWKLANAVSNAGCLGLIGSGSMYPDVLRHHIQQCKLATDKPFGVNLPLLYADVEKHIKVIIEEDVKIVFTSAGNPATFTPFFKERGITVVHVVSSSKFAKKAEACGCDAVVAEGFEAGGHNGREETTSLILTPAVCDAVSIPVIAAGGIATGRQMLAAMALGAGGVQIGTRFVCSDEASSHPHFKQAIVTSEEGDTMLSLKKIVPVRLLKNHFFQQVREAELSGADTDSLKELLGRGRAKKGMFEGELDEGELEIGQVSSMIKDIKPVKEIIEEVWNEFLDRKKALTDPG